MGLNVAFVGQMHYFDCAIPDKIKGVNAISKFDLAGDFSNPNFANGLLKYKNFFDYWIFFRGEFYPSKLLNELKGKKIWISTEPIERGDIPYCMKQGKNRFDFHLHYDKTHLDWFELKGFSINGEFQLPVNLNVFKQTEDTKRKEWDVGFIGRSTDSRERNFDLFADKRVQWLMPIEHRFNFLHVAHGLIGKELVRVINKTKINLNMHIDYYPQLQHRMQNIMACGGFVLSEPLSHSDGLKEYKHYIPFNEGGELPDLIKEYLENDKERNKIASQAYSFVKDNFDAEKRFEELLKYCEGFK